MKTIRENLAGSLPTRFLRARCWWQPLLAVALGFAACAAAAGTPPANDDFANAFILSGDSGTTNGDNTFATLETCETNAVYPDDFPGFPDPITNSVWFAWTAPTNGTLEVDTEGSDPNNDYVLAVWTSDSPVPLSCGWWTDGELSPFYNNDGYNADDWGGGPDASGNSYSALSNLVVTAGITYYFEVASYDDGNTPNDQSGAYELNWSLGPPPPPAPTGAFDSPFPLTGDFATNSVDNTGVVPDPGDPTIAGQTPQNTVWFQWIATQSGEVTVDTYGSVDDFVGLFNLDTVLGVYTGSTLSNLNLVAANDDLYPSQANVTGQYIYTYGSSVFADYNGGTTNPPLENATGGLVSFAQPFGGPSGLRFNAVKGVTYNIAVDTTSFPGLIMLNLALHPSGIFRFATENSDVTGRISINNAVTGLTYSNGTPMLLYQVAATESVAPKNQGGFRTSYNYGGALVTITRVSGSCGRMIVSYTTSDISTNSNLANTNGYLMNGDLAAVGGTDYTPQSGTLTFDDYEMSKTISIAVRNPNANVARPNRDFLVMITNAVADPGESTDVSTPRVDNTYGQALVRILDVNADPRGLSVFQVVTNIVTGTAPNLVTNSLTNMVYSTRSTNAVLNFQKSFFQVLRWGSNQTISVWVNRTGTNTAAASVNYIVNSGYPYNKDTYPNNDDNDFPLQAGSDYAAPDPIDPHHLSKVPDFDFPGGYSGSLSWAANDGQPKAIQFVLYQNQLQHFNEDFQIDLYILDSNGNPHPVGMVNQCNVTIGNANDISAALIPPAGAVDEFYNADFGSDFWTTTDPPYMHHPGTDGEVFGLAVLPDGRAVVAGDFSTYDTYGMNNIALTTPSGYLDHSFSIGSGADDYISSVVLTTNNEILIGGNFSSFDGQSSSGIALLQTTGALDHGFTPGTGFNGLVSALALQPNGQILAGGGFTSYNGVTRNHLARINPDGSLDTTFDPGANLNGAVYAVAVQTNGQIVVGGDFTAAGGVTGQNYLARFNPLDGSLDTTFDPESGPNAAVQTVAVQPDGYILVGGDFSQVNGQALNYVARLDPTGKVDPNFFCGIGVDGPVYNLLVNTNPIYSTTDGSLVQAGFTIYIGGAFTEYNGTHRLGFARLNNDGTVDTTFLDPAYNQFAGLTRVYYDDPLGVVNASAIVTTSTNGDVLIGGDFDQVGGGDYNGTATLIRPTDDTISETGLFRIRSGIRNHSNIAGLIGGATPGPGNIALSYPTYSINESAGSLFVNMVRTNGFLGNASANFSVIPGLAQSGIDYINADSSPLYPEIWDYRQMHSDGEYGNASVPRDNYNTVYGGNIQGAVTLDILGGETTTANLSAEFQMANPAGADKFYLGGQNIPLGVGLGESLAPFTLINDNHNSGTFSFSASNYVVNAGSIASISLVRSNGTYGKVYFEWTTSTNGSTAVLNSDYRANNGQAVFPDGITINDSFTVQTLTTNYVSPVEKYVNLVLYGLQPPVDGVASFGLTNAILRIINPNFSGYLNFSQTNYPVNLSAGAVPVTVTRTVGSKGSLGVTFSTANGTATNGVDYFGTVTNLSWTNGDVSPRTVLVPLIPNTALGSTRFFSVNLSNPTLNGIARSSVLLATNATVTITNDLNSGTFQFSATDYTVDETGGYATLTVNRSDTQAGLQLPASVTYFTVNGAAVAPTNYVSVSNVLNFAAGQISRSFTVAINNDGVTNPPPGQFYFQAVLSAPSTGSLLGVPATCNVHIVDAQSYINPPGSPDTTFNPGAGMNAPVYALAIQTNNLLLAGGAFTSFNNTPITYLTRLNTDGALDTSFMHGLAGINGPVYAVISQTDDGIVVGGAFTDADSIFRNHITRLLTDGSVDTSFNPGSGADSTVYCLAETFIGGSRFIYVGGAFTNMDRITSPGLVRLQNNGTLDPTFNTGLGPNDTVYAVAVYPTNSPDAGKLLIGGSFSAVNNFQAPYLARLNVDGSVDTNFNTGLALDGSVLSIVIQNDGGIVVGGNFLHAYDSAHGTNVVPASHLARIYETVAGTSYLDTTNFAAAFSGGPNGPVNALALQADNRIIVAGGFAEANGVVRNNITRLNTDGSLDPTVNFGNGANAQVYAALVQPADQKIVLGGAFTNFNGVPANYIVRLYGGSDAGVGQFEFSATGYSVPENGLFAPITILHIGGTSGTNSVFFTVSNGTAFAGTNYEAVSQQVVFPPGVDALTVDVPVLDDGVITPNLTATLLLQTNGIEAAGLGDQYSATLTIINEDSGVSFSSASYSVPKNTPSGYFSVDVIRLGATNGEDSVTFVTLPNGTATPGTDFTPTNLVVTFSPGQTDQEVPIQILDNPLPTGNLTAIFALSNAVNTVIYNPSNAVLTIVDTVRVPGQFAFASPVYTVTEGGGVGYTNVNITVVRTNGTAGVVTVNYTTLDGTATAGVKYVPTNGMLNFADGQTSTNFDVQVINTATAEGPETFSVILYNPTGGTTLTSPSNTVVTILNTNTGIAFASAANAFTEPSGVLEGTALLTVLRLNNTNGTTTVTYSTTNGTALANTNFVGITNGTLTFNPGDSMKTIPITTIHDTNVTGDLYFTVGLANPTGGAQLTSPSYTVVTDHDADAGVFFYTNATSVFRNAGYVVIPVISSNPNTTPISVNYSTADGSALAGVDYTATSGTLWLTNGPLTVPPFTNGVLYNYFLVPILINNSVLSNVTFTVSLSSPTAPGQLQPPSTETVTIIGTNTPPGLSFSTPIILNGQWGATNADDTLGAPETGDPSIAGQTPNAPVWFEWTAPISGEVTLDTIGSLSTNVLSYNAETGTFVTNLNNSTVVRLDTVLGVFTGNNLSTLTPVAANDDIYPQTLGDITEAQYNWLAQDIFNTNPVTFGGTNLIFIQQYGPVQQEWTQPYGGPSGLRFNATAGTTYYFAVDVKSLSYIQTPTGSSLIASGGTSGGVTISSGNYEYAVAFRGQVALNWAYHPSGVLRFATEKVDVTGNLNTNGNPLLLYECSETESDRRTTGTVDAKQYPTTFSAYSGYSYDAPGLLVTVTRVAGSSGRIAVDYTTVDGNTNIITNGDLPAQSGTSELSGLLGTADYTPAYGTLVFDDYEMSKTILIPILDDYGMSRPNRDFTVVLSNPRVDPTESPNVSAPRVDPIFGQAECRILDCDIAPEGPTTTIELTTNAAGVVVPSQVVVTLIPTNGVFNFQKKAFRVPRDVNTGFWNNTPVTIYVNRMGTNTAGITLNWRLNNFFEDDTTYEDGNIYFPLQPGSEYSTPPPDGVIYGPPNVDYVSGGGESGTIAFPSGVNSHNPQPITFTIKTNGIGTCFNKDIQISLYFKDSNGGLHQYGMVAECTLTILFDDLTPPAGSVDEFYNPDFGSELLFPTNLPAISSTEGYPGTEPSSEVYSVAVTTNGQAIIGGSFQSYTDGQHSRATVNGLTRLNADGSLDTTFDSGAGINVDPGHEYIQSLALDGAQIVIGGNFTSYRGVLRNNIARVNGDGTLDTSFATGGGANGKVWSVLVQADGKVVIGGEFTTYAGAPANYVARLNTDGSLDNTFNASNILTGRVYSVAEPPATVLNLNHTANGGPQEDDQVLSLGTVTAGTLTVNYNMFIVPDDMRIFYGDTNVAAGTGVLLFDTGNVPGVGTIVLPFGPVNGFATNELTIVMNQGGSTNATTLWTYDASVSVSSTPGLLVGGSFNVSGQSYVNLARLNSDGSLDTTFLPGTGPNSSVLALAWQLDNKVILGGDFSSISGQSLNHLARLNADGSIDSGFYIGTGADNVVNSITLQPLTGQIYAGGPFTSINGTHRLGFVRLNPDGTVDTTFLDTAYNQLAGLPRSRYADPFGAVYSSAVQQDGNVLIAGSFSYVGGGQFNESVRPNDYGYNRTSGTYNPPDPDFNTNLNVDIWPEPKTRDGVRYRGNVARLIGGATPGPGNIGLASPSYSANKTQSFDAVALVRTNGTLGYASANFAVLPGLAKSGVDYEYDANAPVYPIEWYYFGGAAGGGGNEVQNFNRLTRQHSDSMGGANGSMFDPNYDLAYNLGLTGPSAVTVSIINNTTTSGNLNAQYQLANPGADMFYLGGQLIPLGVALGQSHAALTVVDNSQPPGVFGFAAPDYFATNSPVSVAVLRTNGSYGTYEIWYQTVTNGSTAVANVDYDVINGAELTFNNGVVSNAFPVTILNNSSSSGQEKTINVQLYQVAGNAQLGLTNAVVRIINPNFPGYLSFSTNTYYGSVTNGVLDFTVTRTVGSKGTLTVQYGTVNGPGANTPQSPGAFNGVNYVGSTNTLTWNDGDVSPRTVSIPLINNNVTGSIKIFYANLFNATLNGSPAPALFGAVTNANFVILNDNSYGTFQFSSPSYQFNDNGGYATITVTRTVSALTNASVSYMTLDGTAFAGTNYVATNNVLNFTNGQLAQSFNVRLLNDGKTNDPAPANFYFAVQLSSQSSGAHLGSPTNSQVHLVSAQQYNQSPGSVDPSYQASLNGSVLGLALQSSGQIVAGGTFTVANDTSLNRLARFNTDGTLDDSFLLGLAGADGAVNAVVSQPNDRVVVGGAFANIDGIARQGIARLMTDGSLDTSFNSGSGADSTVFALAESLINGANVIYAGGAFSFFNGTSSPGVVRLNDSGLVDTSFAVGGGAIGTVYAVAAYSTNSVYNAGQVLVGGNFTNFNGALVGNLVRLNQNGSVDTNFTQNVSVNGSIRAIAIQLDGSVLIGGEFTSVNGVGVNHLARLTPNGSPDTAFNTAAAPGINGTVSAITLQQDNRIVVAGQFSSGNGVIRNDLTRLLPSGAVDTTINFGSGANGAVNAVVIQATDGSLVIGGAFTQFNGQTCDYIARLFGGSETGSGQFQFSSANYQVDENAGFASITIERTGGTSGTNADGTGDVFVTFSTSDGTATNGINYGGVTNYLDFPAGEVLETVQVPVLNNGAIGPNVTVNMSLSNPTPGASLGDQANALLTIINDNSMVEFLSPTYSVPDTIPVGFATIQVVRLGSTSGTSMVDFSTTTNGTAVIGTDYYPTNEVITFPPGAVTASVQIPVLDNISPEGNQTVTMLLSNAYNSMLAAPSNAVLTIEENSTNPGNIYFTATNFYANANDGTAAVTIGRTNGTAGQVTVTFITVPGTALPGINYVPVTNTATIQAGDILTTNFIQLINDPFAEAPVSLTVTLSNPGNGAGLIAPTNATVTIANTNAVFAFTTATNIVTENQGTASIVVQRFNNLNITSYVQYATTNNTAVAGVNFSNTFGTLTFGVGEAFQSISVPLINRSNIVDLTFGLELFNPVNAQVVAPSNTLVILEPSAAGVSFDTNAATVLSSAGYLAVNVVCSNPGVEPVATSNTPPLEVNYTTVDGTAKAGFNYNAVSGTLLFENGKVTNTFYVPILNTQFLSSNLTFSVILTNVAAPGEIAPYGTQTVAIAEGGAGVSFSQANYNVFKNSGLATITVNRTGFTNTVASVNYVVTNGTAIGGQNFYPTNGLLVFTNGVTSQSFNVTLIANTLVQPNLVALMQLLNPTNAQIISPGAATLTILETGAAYIVPAGSQLLSNSSLVDMTNDVIGSNDTVTVRFAFRDAAGLNVTNLGATLLATNGVTAPTPASNSYGPLTVYGHSASANYTFTAKGTNSFTISPTFQLTADGKFAGVATFVYTLGTWTTTFANTNPIIIYDGAAAAPFPSIINVSGLGNSLVKATVTLTNLSHQNFSDLDALVVSPGGSNTLIVAHAGAGDRVAHVTLTFDDAATNKLPENGGIVSGTNQPTQYYPVPNFP